VPAPVFCACVDLRGFPKVLVTVHKTQAAFTILREGAEQKAVLVPAAFEHAMIYLNRDVAVDGEYGARKRAWRLPRPQPCVAARPGPCC
jgi:hypothetical protein